MQIPNLHGMILLLDRPSVFQFHQLTQWCPLWLFFFFFSFYSTSTRSCFGSHTVFSCQVFLASFNLEQFRLELNLAQGGGPWEKGCECLQCLLRVGRWCCGAAQLLCLSWRLLVTAVDSVSKTVSSAAAPQGPQHLHRELEVQSRGGSQRHTDLMDLHKLTRLCSSARHMRRGARAGRRAVELLGKGGRPSARARDEGVGRMEHARLPQSVQPPKQVPWKWARRHPKKLVRQQRERPLRTRLQSSSVGSDGRSQWAHRGAGGGGPGAPWPGKRRFPVG